MAIIAANIFIQNVINLDANRLRIDFVFNLYQVIHYLSLIVFFYILVFDNFNARVCFNFFINKKNMKLIILLLLEIINGPLKPVPIKLKKLIIYLYKINIDLFLIIIIIFLMNFRVNFSGGHQTLLYFQFEHHLSICIKMNTKF